MSKSSNKPTKMGRPPFPEAKRRTKCVLVRLTPAMHKTLSKAAKREGLPLATWMREQAVKAILE